MIPVPVHIVEGAAVRRVRQVGLLEFVEELQRRKLLQTEDGLCHQLLESTEDVFRQGTEGCVRNVPAETITDKLSLKVI